MPAASQLRRAILIDHTVDFGDDVTVTFRYDRNKITDAWIREWTRFEDEENLGAINSVLADLIESWDVTGDDGGEYQPTADNIGALFSLPDKGMVIRELMAASVPSRAEGNASSERSSIPPSGSEVPPPMSPNGPVTSTPPVHSASLSPS